MQLTVLGCWSPYPRAGGACSGYLLQESDLNIMIDAGNGTFSNLCRHIDFRNLDALIISHLHPDHYSDIYCLYHAINGALIENRRSNFLKVYMPATPVEVVSNLQEKKSLDIVTYENLPVGNTYQVYIKGLLIEFYPVPHSVTGYSVSVTGDQKKFVFSGDCAQNNSLISAAQGADMILIESSGLDRDSEYLSGVHHTARQAGETARQAGVRKALTTHFWPEHSLEDMALQAREGYGAPIETVQENKTYKI